MAAKETPVCDFGRAAPYFELPGTDGRSHSLDSCRGQRGTVVAFICNHCPFVIASIGRLVADAQDLAADGVRFVAIMSNDTAAYPADSFPEMQRHAEAWALPFPYLLDETQEIARAYGAVCTPDYFGYNAAGLLQYRGRLDAGRTGPPPPGASRELLEAMRGVAASGQGPASQTPGIGCSIKWRDSDR